MGACATSKHFSSQLILGRYRMSGEPGAVVGEGSSSVCRRGIDTLTGEEVAIKVYKPSAGRCAGDPRNPTESATVLTKFRRQVAVLQELQKPMEPPADPSLWSEELLTKWLLIRDCKTRSSLAECLSCPYVAQAPAVTQAW